MEQSTYVGRALQSFRGNLIRARERRNLTQAQLAESLEVSRGAVTAWEAGRAYPEFRMIPRLAEALNIPLRELLEGYDDKPRPEPYEVLSERLVALEHIVHDLAMQVVSANGPTGSGRAKPRHPLGRR